MDYLYTRELLRDTKCVDCIAPAVKMCPCGKPICQNCRDYYHIEEKCRQCGQPACYTLSLSSLCKHCRDAKYVFVVERKKIQEAEK